MYSTEFYFDDAWPIQCTVYSVQWTLINDQWSLYYVICVLSHMVYISWLDTTSSASNNKGGCSSCFIIVDFIQDYFYLLICEWISFFWSLTIIEFARSRDQLFFSWLLGSHGVRLMWWPQCSEVETGTTKLSFLRWKIWYRHLVYTTSSSPSKWGSKFANSNFQQFFSPQPHNLFYSQKMLKSSTHHGE